jgi:hypothetical protein
MNFLLVRNGGIDLPPVHLLQVPPYPAQDVRSAALRLIDDAGVFRFTLGRVMAG